jgi:hypothetical protein
MLVEDASSIGNGHLPASKLNHLAAMGLVPRIQSRFL